MVIRCLEYRNGHDRYIFGAACGGDFYFPPGFRWITADTQRGVAGDAGEGGAGV